MDLPSALKRSAAAPLILWSNCVCSGSSLFMASTASSPLAAGADAVNVLCSSFGAQHKCLYILDPEHASKAWRVCCRVWARQQLSSVTLGFLHCGVELFCWLDEGMHQIKGQVHSVPTAASRYWEA